MLIRLSERASEIENIHLAWKEQHWTPPEIIENDIWQFQRKARLL